MVEYKNKLITLQNGGTRNNYYKLYKNGTSKRINKELYLKKVKVGGGYNNNVIQNSIQENINIQNSIPKNINIFFTKVNTIQQQINKELSDKISETVTKESKRILKINPHYDDKFLTFIKEYHDKITNQVVKEMYSNINTKFESQLKNYEKIKGPEKVCNQIFGTKKGSLFSMSECSNRNLNQNFVIFVDQNEQYYTRKCCIQDEYLKDIEQIKMYTDTETQFKTYYMIIPIKSFKIFKILFNII